MITCKRAQFSLPRKDVYLNCAYMSPLLKDSEKAGVREIRRRRNPAVITSEDFFTHATDLCAAFARLVSVSDPERVVIIPSCAYGISNAAWNIPLGKGDNVVVVSEEFFSNYYPWKAHADRRGAELKVVVPPPVGTGRGKTWNLRILEAITKDTRVVALAPVHWTDGTLFDLQAIRKRATEVGALLIVDGTQSVGALPFDVSVLQPDVLVCAAYKWLLGPYSIGLAYYGPSFDNGVPIEEHWMNRMESNDFSRLGYQDVYRPAARRYEVGEHSNFIYVAMLMKSIERLLRWGPQNIQDYCHGITRQAVDSLREKGYWIEDEASRASHLFGIRFHDRDIEALKKSLARHRISVSVRGNAIRVSPNVYNTPEDMARLVKALT